MPLGNFTVQTRDPRFLQWINGIVWGETCLVLTGMHVGEQMLNATGEGWLVTHGPACFPSGAVSVNLPLSQSLPILTSMCPA